MSGVDTTSGSGSSIGGNGVNHVEDFYESWFLEYAGYVILDRAVPNIEDGLKPVQRRILPPWTSWKMEDITKLLM